MRKKTVLACVLMLVIASAKLTAVAPVDDWQTIGLWHMESTISTTDRCSVARNAIADDATVTNSGRSNHLILGRRLPGCADSFATTVPTIVPGLYGNALDFSGGQSAHVNMTWPNYQDVVIELYFYPRSTATNQVLVNVNGAFQLRIMSGTGRVVRAYAWDGAATPFAVSGQFTLNDWNHLVASYVDGEIQISINGVSGASATYSVINNYVTYPEIFIGSGWAATSMPFNGMIDEVKISNPKLPTPAHFSPYQDDFNTFMLFHFDEILEQSPRKTPDDDSYNPGRGLNPTRNLDGILQPTGDPYVGPTLITSFGGDPNEGFKNCFQFDGFRNIKVQGIDAFDTFGIPADNFRIELWAVHDAAKLNDGFEYFFFHQAGRFRFSIRDLANGTWDARFATWGTVATTLDVPVANPGQWHHYAFEFYQGTMKTYIDGALAGQRTAAHTSVGAPVTQIYIGSSNTGGSMIIGRVDEFRISRAVPAEPECGDWGYSIADINQDCYVNIADLKLFVAQWLTDCSVGGNPACE